MQIEAKEFNIKMTFGELWDTFYDVSSALENTVKAHWTIHQAAWIENEKTRLSRLREMALALGRPDMYDSSFNKFTDIISKFNKENNQKS